MFTKSRSAYLTADRVAYIAGSNGSLDMKGFKATRKPTESRGSNLVFTLNKAMPYVVIQTLRPTSINAEDSAALPRA